MKNIKIKPYPNYKITEECVSRDIEPNSKPLKTAPPKEQNKILNFNVPKVAILKFTGDNEQRVCRFGPVIESKGESYFSVFPNPVHLFLDTAINAYKTSEKIKSENFTACGARGKKVEDFTLLDIDNGETHECYNEFLKQRMTSIIMLTTAVEAFLNYSIPNTYVYVTSKGESYDKGRIENMHFKEKLKDVLPLALSRPDFWNNKDATKCMITELYAIRNSLIHLKTNASEDFEAYFEEVNKMAKFNLEKAIGSVIDFMNYTEPDFVLTSP
jgi:hypothetical protein